MIQDRPCQQTGDTQTCRLHGCLHGDRLTKPASPLPHLRARGCGLCQSTEHGLHQVQRHMSESRPLFTAFQLTRNTASSLAYGHHYSAASISKIRELQAQDKMTGRSRQDHRTIRGKETQGHRAGRGRKSSPPSQAGTGPAVNLLATGTPQ